MAQATTLLRVCDERVVNQKPLRWGMKEQENKPKTAVYINQKNRRKKPMKLNSKKSKLLTAFAALALIFGVSGCASASPTLQAKADETDNAVCYIGVSGVETAFATFEDAFTLHQESGAVGTIKLLKNLEAGEVVSTYSYGSTIIDLNGFTFGRELNFYGNDVLIDSSEQSTGVVGETIKVKSGATLRVRGAKIYASAPVRVENDATATFSDGSSVQNHTSGGWDIYLADTATLVLKDAEFPVDGLFLAGANAIATDQSLAVAPNSKAYNEREEETSSGVGIYEIKQQYLATFTQGEDTKQILDESELHAYFNSSENATIPATITLYDDAFILEKYVNQNIEDLTIDLNGNALFRKETVSFGLQGNQLTITDSSASSRGFVYWTLFVLQDGSNDSGSVLTLDCDTYRLNVESYGRSTVIINGGVHMQMVRIYIDGEDAITSVIINGGTFNNLYVDIYNASFADEMRTGVVTINAINVGFNGSDWNRVSIQELDTGLYFTLAEVLGEKSLFLYEDNGLEVGTKEFAFADKAFTIEIHEHKHEWQITEHEHWQMCICGDEVADSRTSHAVNEDKIYTTNAEQHYHECVSCGYTYAYADHEFIATPDSHQIVEGSNLHEAECTTCSYKTVVDCTLEEVYHQPATETELGYYEYACECGYSYQETYCDHLSKTYTQVGTDENPTHIWECLFEDCLMECEEPCVFDDVTHVPSTATSMGYYEYACDCGYSYISDYECDHLSKRYTQQGTDRMALHAWECLVEGCGAISEEYCALNPTKTVMPTKTTIGYYEGVCECGFVQKDILCYHLTKTYTQVGTEENPTHTWVCAIEGCDEKLEGVADCYMDDYEIVFPTATEDGYYQCICECGYEHKNYALELQALGDTTIVSFGFDWVTGQSLFDMNFDDGIYYVNGKDGAIGTVHKEEPSEWHAKLELRSNGVDVDLEKVLILNGLSIQTEFIGMYLRELTTIVVMEGTTNSIASVSSKSSTIGVLSNYDLTIEGTGTLQITASSAEESLSDMGTFALYVLGDYLYIDDVKLSISSSAKKITAFGIYCVYTSYIENVTLDISVSGVSACGIVQEELYIEDSEITIQAFGKEFVYGIKVYGEVAIFDSNTFVTTKITGESTDEMGGFTNAMHLKYLNMQDSTVVLQAEGETVEGINAQYIYSTNSQLNISVLAMEYGNGIYASEGIYFENGSTVKVVAENQSIQNSMLYGIQVTSYDLWIDESKVEVVLLGEATSAFGVELNTSEGSLGLYNSELWIDSTKAVAEMQAGILVRAHGEEYAAAFSVVNSRVEVSYGQAYWYSQGISIQSEGEYLYGAIWMIENSEVRVESVVAEGMQEQTAAIYVQVNCEEPSLYGEGLITVIDSTLEGIVNVYSDYSYGMYVEFACEESDTEYFWYAQDSSLTFISGDAHTESIGLYIVGNLKCYDPNKDEWISNGYMEYGVALIDSQTLIKSGTVEAYTGKTVGFYGDIDTDDELLYIKGGRFVAIAPDTYSTTVNGVKSVYNQRSYALWLESDDGELRNGIVELRAGSYCVVGDFDVKYDETQVMIFSDNYDGSAGYISGESDVQESECDMPKSVLIVEQGVYFGGVIVRDGEYYVNGENGGRGTSFVREPDEWNAKVELCYDEEKDTYYYAVTLNGLHITVQENSLLPVAIFADAEIRFTDLGERKNTVQAGVTNPRFESLLPSSITVTLQLTAVTDGATANDGNEKDYTVGFATATQVPNLSTTDKPSTDDPTTDTPTKPTGSVKSDSDALPAGAVVAISVGGTVAVVFGGFAIVWFVIKKKTFADLLEIFR